MIGPRAQSPTYFTPSFNILFSFRSLIHLRIVFFFFFNSMSREGRRKPRDAQYSRHASNRRGFTSLEG